MNGKRGCGTYIQRNTISHKKKRIWVSSNELDKPRAHRTEWSKAEREIQTSYTDTHTWNPKRRYWWIHFQGSNGERHREQTHGHGGVEEGQGETYTESNMETHNTTCKTDSQREPAVWPRGLKQGPCDNSCDRGAMQRELGGRPWREGTWEHLCLTLADVHQKTTKFFKAIIL